MSERRFAECISDKRLEDLIAQSRLTASQQLGVKATPTFFINGEKFDGEPTAEAFDQILSELYQVPLIRTAAPSRAIRST
jgi:protein-disulfide isomerase